MITIYEERIVNRGNQFEVEDGVARIKDGSMAFHHDSEGMYGYIVGNFTDKEICDLTSVSYFRPFPAAMTTGKGSAYRELFNLVLQQCIIESGVVKKEHIKYFTPRPECIKSNVEVFPVAIDTVTAPLLIFLICGVLGSLVVLLIEVVVYKCTHRR